MNSSVRSMPIIIPIWISVLYFATVHELAQFTLIILTICVSYYALSKQTRRPPTKLMILLALAFGGMLIATVPLPVFVHQALQPKFAMLASAGITETNTTWQPLALRPRKALLGLLVLASCAVYVSACGAYFYRVQRFYRAVKYVVGCAMVLCLLAWAQKLTNASSIYWISGIPTFYREPFFGSFVNPNHAGAFLAGVLPLCFTKKGPTKYLYLCFLLIGLWTTQSRGAIIAGASGLCLYTIMAVKNQWKWLFIGGGVVTIGIALSFAITRKPENQINMENIDVWSSSRIEIWDASVSLLFNAPVFGVGRGGFIDAYATVKQSLNHTITHHAHQEILEVLITFGWFSGGIFLYLWLYVIRSGLERIRATKPMQERRWVVAALSGFVAMSVSCLIDFPLQIGANLLLFCFLASVLIAKQFQQHTLKYSFGIFGIVTICSLGILITHKTKALSPYSDQAFWLEQAKQQKDDPEQARRSLLSAVKAAPVDSRPLRLYGLSLRNEDVEKALTLVEHATTMAPKNSLTWMSLAELHNLQRNSAKAWSAWKNCLALDLPNNDESDRYVRMALISGSQPQKAFLHALPDREDRRQQAAIILAEWGYDKEAEILFQQLVTANTDAKIAYANFLLQRKKYVKAWKILKNTQPKNCLIARTKAKILNRLNAAQQAKEHYREAISKCGKEDALIHNMLFMRLRLAEEKAIEQAQQILQQDPDHHRLRRELIYALLKNQEVTVLKNHLQYLSDQQEATNSEQKALENILQQLPPKPLQYKQPIDTKSLNME